MEGIRITPIAQYTIDAVRRMRLEKGISQRELSSAIGASPSFVGNVENPNDPHKYQIHHLKPLARKLGCGVHDLVPETPLPDDSYQIKTVTLIDEKMGPTAILYALLEEGFFNNAKTIGEITKRCNSFSDVKRKMTDFSSTLAKLIEKNILQKEEIDDNHVKYKKAK